MAARKVLVCQGRHCRRKRRESPRFDRALAGLPVDLVPVPCQKVCSGPVVGTSLGGRWEWFERMDSRKALQGLAALVEDGELPRPLRKRRQAKRRGRLRT